MRVLLAALDIFRKSGGGESFYQALIARNPQIEFCCYTRSREELTQSVPANVRLIDLREPYRDRYHAFALQELQTPIDQLSLADEAERIAFVLDLAGSAARQNFDMVDIPDFLVQGWLLPFALRYFGAKIGKVVLSMHGTISDALSDNWAGEAVGDLSTLERTESLLYRTCDVRYGIGERYLAAWAETERLPAELLGHGYVFDYERFTRGRDYRSDPRQTRPDLAFVGRQDRWKGPDLFLDLCAQLPKGSFRYIHLYGPGTEVAGRTSLDAISSTAGYRELKFQSNRAVPHPMLQELFATRAMVTVLPSRRDTFNLAAVDSLLNGCPTAVSNRAGAVDFLDRAFPGLPYLKLDIADFTSSLTPMVKLCESYDQHREMLRDYLKGRDPLPYGRPLEPIYAAASTADPASVRLAEQMAEDVLAHVHDRLLPAAERNAREEIDKHFAATLEWSQYDKGSEPFVTAFERGAEIARIIKQLNIDNDPATSLDPRGDSDTPVRTLARIIHSADRARIFRLLAFLEQQRGNDLLYATYLLRFFRLTGRCSEPELASVERVLAAAKFVEEARVARLIHGEDGGDAIYRYLNSRIVPADLSEEAGIAERLDLRRNPAPQVSVIVSVYNGGHKVSHFLTRLAQMTEQSRAITEIIFVDSNSTDDTRSTLLKRLRQHPFQGTAWEALYLRSERRETIQQAWNRGIAAARGRYLSFLGVDEGVRPDAFEQLVALFERRPDVDWAQGYALVTEVDENGTHMRDIFPHRRSTESQNIHYLECCHIGYVGAAYRRDLHTRFGMYDPTFRAAGDNEFKNRILPFIKVMTIPEIFGTFYNYPETRTTESPVAELEDLRAWYIHRTAVGIRYAFERQSDEECVAQFFRALKYRRSFLTFESTDYEYAIALASYVAQYRPHAFRAIETCVPPAGNVLFAYRGLDEISPNFARPSLIEIEERAARVRDSIYGVGVGSLTLVHRGFRTESWYRNDNRTQQHYFHWPSYQRRFAIGPRLGWGDLAGAADLGEVLITAIARDSTSDLAPAEPAIENGQSCLLSNAPVLHAVVPVAEGDATREAIACLIEASALGKADFTAVIAGPVEKELHNWAPAGIHFAPMATNLRPLLAAAHVLLLPTFDTSAGEALFADFVMAVGHGRPILAGSGIAAALERRGLPRDLAAAVVVDRCEDIWPKLVAALAQPDRLADMAMASARIGGELRSAGVIAEACPAGQSAPFWDSEIKDINKTITLCLENRRDARFEVDRLAARFRSNEEYRAKVTAILRALFVDKAAPCLAIDRPAWRHVRQFRPVGSPVTALALLYAAAEGPDLLERSAEFLPHGLAGMTLKRAGTALDEWRRGISLPTEAESATRAPEIVVLVESADGEAPGPAHLAAEVVGAIIRRTGAAVAANAALDVVGEVELLATATAIRQAVARADLVICLGGSRSYFSPNAFRLAAIAMGSGRPVIGNSSMFWYFEGTPPPFVCDDPVVLRARAEDALSRYSPSPAASYGRQIGASGVTVA